jgi:hypothetical protein
MGNKKYPITIAVVQASPHWERKYELRIRGENPIIGTADDLRPHLTDVSASQIYFRDVSGNDKRIFRGLLRENRQTGYASA